MRECPPIKSCSWQPLQTFSSGLSQSRNFLTSFVISLHRSYMTMKTMAIGRSEQSEPRLPPQNLEAEQCILGAILLENPAMAKAMELITEEDFYRTSHK